MIEERGCFRIEFVNNPKELKPLGKTASDVVNKMKDNGVLLSTDGPDNNVIKIKPPGFQ